MKIMRIIFFALLALGLIACSCLIYFFNSFDCGRYFSHITRKTTLLLGRPVSVGHWGMGISWRGVTLEADGVTIADDPAFTTQPFIYIDKVRIVPDLKSLIVRHAIYISSLVLQSPQIHFIRAEGGQYNTNSLGQRDLSAQHHLAAAGNPLAGVTQGHRTVFPLLSTINVRDVSISFIDQSRSLPEDIWLKLNNVRLNISSGGGPSAKGNLSISGGVIKNLNLVKMIFSHAFGNIVGPQGSSLEDLLEGHLKDKWQTGDIDIEKAQARFALHDQRVVLEESFVQTNIFDFQAEGALDQGLNMDLDTKLQLKGDTSALLAEKFHGFKFLMDNNNRISIDASLTGTLPHLKYKPNKDFRKKSKKAFMAEEGDILGMLLK